MTVALKVHFFLSLLFAALSTALPFSNNDAVATIWTFPNETWVENLAVRQNGAVLCTSISRAAIYQVDPFSHVAATVHQFDILDGVLGIAEIENDIFVAVTATIDLATNMAKNGSAKIWRVDMCAWSLGAPNPISLISNLPEVGLPDGVTPLPTDPGVVLVADADKGLIWRVSTTTGAHTIAISDPAFKYTSPLVPIGVNGLKILDDELYFTNLAANLIARIPITANGSASGSVQKVSTETLLPDDFALAGDGTIYAAGYNTLWRVMPDGTTDALVGGPNSTAVQGITSAQFGRTREDGGVLYISTTGGLLLAPAGARVHGGQLLAVNVGLFG
ncbi:uncharacterized protein LTR77_000874 [Saxophila tyrrhenica]|uniref:SMP-30/Gluconolactonase/LRE-like region domain-containing protein n=1 Tax=Saxophila tyrrhenica TaxID=1690608 RepID=A0AAV9PSJ9_9PEZI|nr:hypothetical protein LTR77_000874 [Saxophila tyrrhenica]